MPLITWLTPYLTNIELINDMIKILIRHAQKYRNKNYFINSEHIFQLERGDHAVVLYKISKYYLKSFQNKIHENIMLPKKFILQNFKAILTLIHLERPCYKVFIIFFVTYFFIFQGFQCFSNYLPYNNNIMIKRTLILALLAISCFSWTTDQNVAACQTVNAENVITQITGSKFILTDAQLLGTTQPFKYYILGTGSLDAYSHDTYQFYVSTSTSTGSLVTSLAIVNVSNYDGTESITQPAIISNIWEIIDIDGSIVMLKQTVLGVNYITFYSVLNGVTTQLSAPQDLSSWTGKTFQKIWFMYQQNKQSDDVVALIQVLDTAASNIQVYKITSIGGLDLTTNYYKFPLANLASDFYVNQGFGLEVDTTGTSLALGLYTYDSSGTFVVDSSTLASLTTTAYNKYKVINFQFGMIIVLWDGLLLQSTVFDLQLDDSNVMHFESQLSPLSTACSVTILSDDSSYVIHIDHDANNFFLKWADDILMYSFTYINSVADANNAQIIQDFTAARKISTFMDGHYFDQGYDYTQNKYFYLYTGTTIVKYTINAYQAWADSQTLTSTTFTINKEFSVTLDSNVQTQLVNAENESFQFSVQLKCLCTYSSITSFLCFYGTNGCTFAVQSKSQFCNPSPP